MKYYGTEYKRLIDQWHVCIRKHKIEIVGNFYSNHGLIYPNKVRQWVKEKNTQVIGMDHTIGLTKQVLEYIHNYIEKYWKQIEQEGLTKLK